MKKLIIFFLLISLNAFSQLTINVKSSRSTLLIYSGVGLTGVGMITPSDYNKKFYKQPNKYIPVYLGISLIMTGYIERMIKKKN